MMNAERDPLQELLRRADKAAGPPPPISDDLAARVLRTAARRRPWRFAIAAAAALLIATGAGLWTVYMVSPEDRPREAPDIIAKGPSEPSHPDTARELAEIERLRAEADRRAQIATAMAAHWKSQRRLAELNRRLQQPDPLERTRREVEQTACILLRTAERRCQEPRQLVSCVEAYERVIELFPETHAAKTARKQLNALQPEKGGLL
jgi:hypothetical protein